MPVFLNELQAGRDKTVIGFPHLLLCMGVVLEGKNWLYGFHFDAPSQTKTAAEAFLSFIRSKLGGPGWAVRLYGCCNWKERYHGGGRSAWEKEMKTIASVLGYHGKVSGFDTQIIDPTQGTYVQYLADYQQKKCRIFYKRNEKMNFTNQYAIGMPTTEVVSYRIVGDQWSVKTGSVAYTSDADILVTKSNKGHLHELDYFLRLKTFDIH